MSGVTASSVPGLMHASSVGAERDGLARFVAERYTPLLDGAR